MFKQRLLRKGFISMIVITMGCFLTISMIAVTKFNSQIMYSSERSIVEAQTYYNAYSAIQRGIYEIRQNKKYSGWDNFSLSGSDLDSNATKNPLYAKYSVTASNRNNVYYYVINGTGYGQFKGASLETSLEAHMVVDYNKEKPIYQIAKIIVK